MTVVHVEFGQSKIKTAEALLKAVLLLYFYIFNLVCIFQIHLKMLKYTEDFQEKSKTQTKL